MSHRTMGSLTIDDVTRQAKYQEPGLLAIGQITSIEHSTDTKGEPRTQVRLKVPGAGYSVFTLTRPSHVEIDIEPLDALDVDGE